MSSSTARPAPTHIAQPSQRRAALDGEQQHEPGKDEDDRDPVADPNVTTAAARGGRSGRGHGSRLLTVRRGRQPAEPASADVARCSRLDDPKASFKRSSIAPHARRTSRPTAPPARPARDPARSPRRRGGRVDGRRVLGQSGPGRLGCGRGPAARRADRRAVGRRGTHDEQPDGVHGGARGAALPSGRQPGGASSPTRA